MHSWIESRMAGRQIDRGLSLHENAHIPVNFQIPAPANYCTYDSLKCALFNDF